MKKVKQRMGLMKARDELETLICFALFEFEIGENVKIANIVCAMIAKSPLL